MRRQTLWRMLLTAAFLALMPWVAQAEIDPATVQKLIASDGNFYYSLSVSVSGDTLVIGNRYDDDKGTDSGSAYIFTRAANGAWIQQAKLTATDAVAGDRFGGAVAISGDTVVIGAQYADGTRGAAYIFSRTGGIWSQRQKLLDTNRAQYNWFGGSVSVSGDIAVIGAGGDSNFRGAAYIFTRTGGVWSLQQKLTAADRYFYDWFGTSVSLSADTIVIGAFCDDSYQGSAYVFTRAADGTWSQQQKLTATDGSAGDWFGRYVSVYMDTIVVGAINADNRKGSAYVFTRAADETWSQQQKLPAADGVGFGAFVSLALDMAVIGRDDSNFKDGAYIFTRAGGVWSLQQKLIAKGGWAVSTDGNTVVIGATGSVYVFGSSNTAPVANAGPNQSIIQGEKVCFDGSGSTDADNDPLAYLWTLDAWPAGSSAVLDNQTAEKPCITADLPGTYKVSLVVNDGIVDSSPSTAEAVAISCQDVAGEAIKAINSLDPSAFKNEHNQPTLTNKINEVITWINQGLYQDALDKLQHDILSKTDGCAGGLGNNDWLDKDCADQAKVYPLIQQTMVCVQRL